MTRIRLGVAVVGVLLAGTAVGTWWLGGTTLLAGQGAPARAASAEATSLAGCALPALEAAAGASTTVTEASVVPAGGFSMGRGRGGFDQLPAFCRVHAVVTPTEDSRVEFEVWAPEVWNGKLVVTGNGGYGNTPNYGDMAIALARGYAAVGGDTGHQTDTPNDLLWGVGHPQKIADWGTHSIHAITGPARTLVAALRDAEPSRAYYYGCSTGGHQAYAEIQHYPEDFDGVIAGAPGNNRVRLNIGFLWQFLANHREGDNDTPIVPASKLPIVTAAAVEACDALDGVTDGVVDDPRMCPFDPAELACTGSDTSACLTTDELAALQKMYAGAVNPRTGETLYPGWPVTSEALTVAPDGTPRVGWHQYWGRGGSPTRAEFWQHWVFEDADWDWWSFDFDRDVALADEKAGDLVDQIDPDIAAFREAGAKAIVYQGWQDPVVNAVDTIAYYEAVRAQQGSQEATDEFFRLFLVPGMGHCGGGTGATSFGNQGGAPVVDADHDLLSALDAWVEQGRPPDRIVASRVEDGMVTRTRPICPYPERAVYTGQGSTGDADSFVCATSEDAAGAP